MMQRPTVYVVDDDASIRRTLPAAIRAPDYDVVAFESAEAFLAAYDGQSPGCLVLDLRMPSMSGLALQSEIAKRDWNIPIIFFSAYGTVESATQAMKAGAVYFIEKPVEPAVLLARIEEAMALDATQRQGHSQRQDINRRISRLTRRQKEVLELVLKGLTSKQIAEALGRSVKTVEVHRSQILRRMNVQGVAELMNIVFAARGTEGKSDRKSDGAAAGKKKSK